MCNKLVQIKARIRAKVKADYSFRVIKGRSDYAQAKPRELTKNTTHLVTQFAPSYLWVTLPTLLIEFRACLCLKSGKFKRWFFHTNFGYHLETDHVIDRILGNSDIASILCST